MQRKTPRAHAAPEAPHHDDAGKQSRLQRRLEIYITTFIGITGFAAAWSGYEASRWAGVQTQRYGQANVFRVQSTKLATLAGQERLSDLLEFKSWVEAYARNDMRLASFERDRFRPELRRAFAVWMASKPLQNPNAARNPLELPEYRNALADSADRLEAQASTRASEGQTANERSDQYVFAAVLLASVLSLTLIAQRATGLALRAILLAIAGGICLIALVRLATSPIA